MLTEGLQLKYPIVLIHGLGARSSYGPIEYFYKLPKVLREAKNQVFIANLTPWHTIEHRAEQLRTQIVTQFPEGKVNLLGHSMGGLDARLLISKLQFSQRIASLTTIGTPHRGTSVGDVALGILPDKTFQAVDLIAKLMNSSSLAFKQLTRQYCTEQFNREVLNDPKVAYYSATTAIATPILTNALPLFWLSHGLISKREGDNDGFVSVESARWGEHLCTYAGDHYSQIGQFLGRARGMDYLKFYTEIFTRLKRDGH